MRDVNTLASATAVYTSRPVTMPVLAKEPARGRMALCTAVAVAGYVIAKIAVQSRRCQQLPSLLLLLVNCRYILCKQHGGFA